MSSQNRQSRAAVKYTSIWVPLFAACALVLFDNAFTPVNTDLGWMLAYGREALSAGRLPMTNLWSFTEPTHSQLMPEWLACITFFWLQQAFGAAGLIAGKWSLAVGTMVAVCAGVAITSRHLIVRGAVGLLAANALWMGFELVRSQLFTMVFLAVLVWLALAGTRRSLWAAAVIFLPWANFHGGFLAGLVVFGGVCLAQVIEQRQAPIATIGLVDARELIALPFIAALLTLVNPWGTGMIVDTIAHIRDPSRLLVREWMPLWKLQGLVPAERLGLISLGVMLVGAVVVLPRKQLKLWFLLIFAVASSLSASRHLRLAPLLIAPVAAFVLERLLMRLDEARRNQIERWVAVPFMLIGLLWVGSWAVRLGDALHFIDPGAPSPANVIAVMRANHLCGRVWNDYDWGGMAIWALPESKVACDGRHGLAYSTEVIQTIIGFGEDGRNPITTLDRYGADLVLLPRTNPALPIIERTFGVVFCDDEACLFSRNPAHLARRDQLREPKRVFRPSDLFDAPGGLAAHLDPGVCEE